MHTLTKTLLTSLALTLAACDEPMEYGDDFGDDAAEFRPGFGGFQLNTSLMAGHPYDVIDLTGVLYKGVKLTKVCLAVGDKPCLTLGVAAKGTIPDQMSVKESQLFGKKNDHVYSGTDFAKSRWYLQLDHDNNGVIDSTIQLVLNDVKSQKTIAPSPVLFWNYYWAYDSKTATGLITKFIKQQEAPTPMCEADPDTGSLGSVLLENTFVDTSPTTKGVFEEVANSMFVACHSGAAGKAPGWWGYAMHDVTRDRYTNIVRAIRADYGNDGVPWTAPGQALTVTDDIVVNKEYDPSLKLEGLLSLDKGWLCIFEPRLASLADVVAKYPSIRICDEKAVVGDVVDGVVSNMMTQPVP